MWVKISSDPELLMLYTLYLWWNLYWKWVAAKGSVLIFFLSGYVWVYHCLLTGLHHTVDINRNLRSTWIENKEMLLKLWIKHTLSWEKHHLNLLKLFTAIIQALNKIKTMINIILDALLQKICFGKLQTVGMCFLSTYRWCHERKINLIILIFFLYIYS